MMAEGNDSIGSSFDVRFLTVDGKPLTVIGAGDAIEALEQRLRDAPDVELHGSSPRPRPVDTEAHTSAL
jgi:hypothetical protein